jgi:hypothetical protein
MDLIKRAYKAAEQTPPTGDVLDDKLETWAETLEPVPTMLLEERFRKTLHEKNNNFVVSPQEMLAGYNRDQVAGAGSAEELHKRQSWAVLAASGQGSAPVPPRPVKECAYPGCTERAASCVVARYCLRHGDGRQQWRVPKELYRMMLEASATSPGQ